MGWISVSFEVGEDDAEALSDALLAAGAASVELTDAEAGSETEQARFDEPGTAGPRPWRRSVLSALFNESIDVTAVVAAACAGAGVAPPPHRTQRLADRDWVLASREQFEPLRISPRLWVVPSWHAPPDPGAINLLLDPGLAFGTGSHPTTRLCLQWLQREVRPGVSVVDYGCGSGILAIAAMKLGAARADAVDIDERALLAARGNALHNRVDVSFHSAAGAIRRPAQVVVANILARPLVVLAPLLAGITAPGGRLALAGLLDDQAAEVGSAYRPWFELDPPASEAGWALLGATRRP